MTVDQTWQGRLIFDKERHRVIMKLPLDYPRINQFPEWFTVNPERKYSIDEEGHEPEIFSGKEMAEGIPVKLNHVLTKRFTVNHSNR